MGSLEEKNIVWHKGKINRRNRERLLAQKGVLVFFTGLSGAGKSTIANAVEERLYSLGRATYLLDGDNIRYGLNSDLGFSKGDREENIRRIGEVSKLLVDSGIITLAAFIAPFEKDRERLKEILGEDYIEVYVKCSLEECEKRDPKGLYKRVRNGEISEFTGISSPYEEPRHPKLIIDSKEDGIEIAVEKVISILEL